MDVDYELLAERYKRPKHKKKLKGAFTGEASNSPCGDNIKIYISVGAEGKIRDAAHDGHSCALATVSADMLCDYAIGKRLGDVCNVDFEKMVRMLGFTPSIGRAGCVRVSLDAFHDACRTAMRTGKRRKTK
ncbi:MAG: iron-sulfur cluster assembly scaffold protein [Candidatus Micrarchaeota archaeon]|nr:iron-sulfur cluster assembly scaffold protein [Candidatus Micrarchaeota archaeon]